MEFSIFGKGAIRHIQMAICHMWRVANELDNADLWDWFQILPNKKSSSDVMSFSSDV